MNNQKQKLYKRSIRRGRVRAKISGSKTHPRLAVFKANRHIYAQAIDDVSGKTLASASSLEVKTKGKKSDVAKEVGKLIAGKLTEKKVKAVRFDRGGFAYHGRIKSLAEGAREGGLVF